MSAKPVAWVKEGMFKVPIYEDLDGFKAEGGKRQKGKRRYYYARYRVAGSSTRTTVRRKNLDDLKKTLKKTLQSLAVGVPDLDNLTVEQSLAVSELLRRNITVADLDKLEKTTDKTIEDAIERYRDSVRESTGGPYQQSLKTHLGQFAKAFSGRKLATLGVDELDRWLMKVAPKWRNRRNKRACLVSLFNYAREKGWVPMNARHAAERTTQAKPPKIKQPISTWSPEEMRKILEVVPADYLPWVVLVGFGGLRTEELFPWDRTIGTKKPVLQWEDIRWDAENPTIYVSAEVAKEDDEREIPLTPQMMEWLKPFAHREGQICPDRQPGKGQLVRPQRQQGIEKPDVRSITKLIADELGCEYRRNAFRHSFGTYAVRKRKSVGEVALLMGNSEGIVKRHYKQVKGRTDADASEWFSIMPKNVNRELRVVA